MVANLRRTFFFTCPVSASTAIGLATSQRVGSADRCRGDQLGAGHIACGAGTSTVAWGFNGKRLLPVDIFELADTHLTIGEHGTNFEMAAQSLDILN